MDVNDTFKAEVTIKKVKKGNATVIEINGQRYILDHKDQYRGMGMKDLKWLREEVEKLDKETSEQWPHEGMVELPDVLRLIDQLDEPEVLTSDWIDEHKENWQDLSITGYSVPEKDLQNLLVPKQEEVDQAYKDGYETGKQHATEKQSEETETVAGVLVDYLIASAKLKMALSMEVEELEE